jgi:branched-chain amino acid transport system permease protein
MMQPAMLRRIAPLVLVVALLAVFPWFGGKFYVDLIAKVMILSIFALSLELLVGTTGLVSAMRLFSVSPPMPPRC